MIYFINYSIDFIKKFIDKITTTEGRGGREIVMPLQDAKQLRDEITKLLIDKTSQEGNTNDKIEVVLNGGKYARPDSNHFDAKSHRLWANYVLQYINRNQILDPVE